MSGLPVAEGEGSRRRLLEIYETLLAHFGPRGWWPASTPFEVVVGAILTQSVAWRNVEIAIENLRRAELLDPFAIERTSEEEIARQIVSTRYYRQKARKLKGFCSRLVLDWGGDLQAMLTGETSEVRRRLLALWGIGPETADSILLYAGEHPIFVVDAYTLRIFHRLGLFPPEIGYDAMQAFFHRHLPADVPMYNEYHALIVGTGNRYCKAKEPLCAECPLRGLCPTGIGRTRGAPEVRKA